MASDDFRNNEAEFLPTNRNRTSHIFEVDAASHIVDVGSELIVDVDARNIPLGLDLDQSSNFVRVVGEGGEGGDGGDGGDGEDGQNGSDTLNFDIVLERTGLVVPENGDFIAGEDIVTALLNVTVGEIVETKVRWIVATDNWETGVPNIQDFTGD